MWSKQIETENSSHSDLSPPSFIYALDAGGPESAVAPSGATRPPRGELGDRGPASSPGPGAAGAAWGRLDLPKAPLPPLHP